MPTVVIVGAQWGDEGKGKIVDLCTEYADMVVRYAGGPNAGHTLVVGDDKLIVRLIPSGILRKQTRCVLAQGMVIDPAVLITEMDELDNFVLRLSERIKKPVTFRNPISDATLPDGSRINIVYGGDISTRGSNFTIRKFTAVPLSPVIPAILR